MQVCSSPHCWVRPLDRSTLGLHVGWPGGFQIGSTPSPINHNASSEGQVAGRAPGIAVVDAHAVGQAPADEDVAEHLLDRLRGDVFPPAVGGNLGGQDGPRGLIGHRQPADALAGGQRHVLDGVDLPDLVGLDRLGDHDGDRAAAPRPMDSGPDEGELETSDRGEAALGRVLAELESDQPGAPGRVFALEIAGDLEQFLDSRGDRTTTGAIVGSQSLAVVSAEQPPDVPDRAIGDRQLGRDPGQGDALLMTSHDLLAERDRERARHGSRLRSFGERD